MLSKHLAVVTVTFEDVKRILVAEKDGYLYHKKCSEKEIKRITEVLDDFENYYKYSTEALFNGWREPTEEVTKDRLLSCLERHNNWIKRDQDRIDEIDLALTILQEYEENHPETGSDTDV